MSLVQWKLIFLLLLDSILCIPTQERSLRVVLLELDNLLQSLLLDEYPEGSTESDLHDVGLEIIIGESEVEISLGVFLNTGNEIFLQKVISKHLHILDGVLVGGHGLVETLVVVEIVFLPLLAKSHGQLLSWLHLFVCYA